MKKIFFLVFLIHNFTHAQQALFNYINESEFEDFSTDSIFQTILSTANTTSHIGPLKLIQFNDIKLLGSTSENFIFIYNNDGIELSQSFKLKTVHFVDSVRFSINYISEYGYGTLFITPEGISAEFHYMERTFIALPIGGKKAILLEKNNSTSDINNCLIDHLEKINNDINYCEGDCGSAILDVLILITPESYTWMFDRYSHFYMHFLFEQCQTINLAFKNSEIPNKSVRFSTVSFTPDFLWHVHSNPATRMNRDINSLENSQSALNLRNLYGADILILLTNNNYEPLAGQVNSLIPNQDNKIAVVEVSQSGSAGGYTLAHELGHHFGATHQEEFILTPGCPDAMRLDNGKFTLMSSFTIPTAYILHYSNPDVEFLGLKTGIINRMDNAQQIKKSFCSTAAIKSTREYTILIDQLNEICLNQPITFTSNIIIGQCIDNLGSITPCGLPPYTYYWELSYEPTFSNSIIVGNSPNLTLTNPPCNGCLGFYLRCGVLSSDQKYAYTTNFYTCPWIPCTSELKVKKNETLKDSKFAIKDEIRQISINSNLIQKINFKILNYEGKVVSNGSFFSNRGEIDKNNIPTGIYFLIINDNYDQTFKFIVH